MRCALTIALSLPIASCAGGTNIAGDYLGAIENGDITTARELFCLESGFEVAEVQTASSWELSESTMREVEGGLEVKVQSAQVGRAGYDPQPVELWITNQKTARKLVEAGNRNLAQAGVTPPEITDEMFTGKSPCLIQVLLSQ